MEKAISVTSKSIKLYRSWIMKKCDYLRWKTLNSKKMQLSLSEKSWIRKK